MSTLGACLLLSGPPGRGFESHSHHSVFVVFLFLPHLCLFISQNQRSIDDVVEFAITVHLQAGLDSYRTETHRTAIILQHGYYTSKVIFKIYNESDFDRQV